MSSINVCCYFGFCVELKLGQKLNEGKTKQIFEIVSEPGHVLVQSKDQITAGNAVRKDQMEGKAAIANKTTSCVFKLLQDAGELLIFLSFHFLSFLKVYLDIQEENGKRFSR